MKMAILGFGVVGSGAYEAAKCAGIEVKRILDIAVKPGYEGVMTTDIADILNDAEIGVVAEVIGGLHPAYELVIAAMRAGKHVVSANKQLISHYYNELHSEAAACGVQLRYTASAGGGIPWLYNLKRAKRCDEITDIAGIINGTTNFILDAMHGGADFAQALGEAQRLGYAEANPSADIDGLDLQRKCAISASIAFDCVVSEAEVSAFGIRSITAGDVAEFERMGFICKLMANAKRVSGGISAYVQPALVKGASIMACVPSNYNMVELTGKNVGKLAFFGQGAGKMPTGTAVVQDVIDIMADVGGHAACNMRHICVNNSLVKHTYYVRTDVPVGIQTTAKLNDCAYITAPMTVSDMFALANEIMTKDSKLFFAGINED
ncbi:MAG: homoserine dehydrogenase [Clostridia bacterium]